MDWLINPELWIAFFTLTALEIVLGIDNIIMISILVGRMPKEMQPRTRLFGLALAMVTRILLLLSISWVIGLTVDLFQVFGQGIAGGGGTEYSHAPCAGGAGAPEQGHSRTVGHRLLRHGEQTY